MKRARFIQLTAATAAAALIGGRQAAPSAEGLAIVRADLERLRAQARAVSRGSIVVPVTQQADYLAGMLRASPESAPLRRELAELTAEMAMLAAWSAQDQQQFKAATYWTDVAIFASKAARNPDLLAMGYEDQALNLDILGRCDEATWLLGRIPFGDLEPATRASVSVGPAILYGRFGNAKQCRVALDRLVNAAGGGVVPGFGRLPVDEQRVTEAQGYALAELGVGREAYDLLAKLNRPQWLNKGLVQASLAMAAAQIGEIEQAASHATEAHRVFAAAGSLYQRGRVEELRANALAPYDDLQAIRDLDEAFRAHLTGTRYQLTSTARKTTKVHVSSCQYVRRGGARPWPAGEQVAPEALASSPLLGTGRQRFELCAVCLT